MREIVLIFERAQRDGSIAGAVVHKVEQQARKKMAQSMTTVEPCVESVDVTSKPIAKQAY